MSPDDSGLRFILEQVSRQNQDLKVDLRTEMAVLRRYLTAEFGRHDTERRELREEMQGNQKLTDERLTELQQFKWKTAGVMAVILFIADVLIKVVIK